MCSRCTPQYFCIYLLAFWERELVGIARDAIAYGEKEGFDVVLIDSAGRIQNDEPLMHALAKVSVISYTYSPSAQINPTRSYSSARH